jgi:hypothetical protein
LQNGLDWAGIAYATTYDRFPITLGAVNLINCFWPTVRNANRNFLGGVQIPCHRYPQDCLAGSLGLLPCRNMTGNHHWSIRRLTGYESTNKPNFFRGNYTPISGMEYSVCVTVGRLRDWVQLSERKQFSVTVSVSVITHKQYDVSLSTGRLTD